MKIFLPLLLLLLALDRPLRAQEQMMAQHNMLFSINYGLSNALLIGNQPTNFNQSGESITYKVKFQKPITLTYEYALRNQTNIGLNMSYCGYKLSELHILNTDTSSYSVKGSHLSIQLRSLRYLAHRRKFMLYFFGLAGIKTIKYAVTSTENNTLTKSHLKSYFQFLKNESLSYSLGIGLGSKILVTKNIGLNLEVGIMNPIAQVGLFYRILESSRKTKDVYGW